MCLKVVAQPQRARAAEILHLGLVSETDQEVSPKTSDRASQISCRDVLINMKCRRP